MKNLIYLFLAVVMFASTASAKDFQTGTVNAYKDGSWTDTTQCSGIPGDAVCAGGVADNIAHVITLEDGTSYQLRHIGFGPDILDTMANGDSVTVKYRVKKALLMPPFVSLLLENGKTSDYQAFKIEKPKAAVALAR